MDNNCENIETIEKDNIIENPWLDWETDDIILAKNGFPMIGLNLKESDNYLEKVHQGYQCDYEPMKELLKSKIEDELIN